MRIPSWCKIAVIIALLSTSLGLMGPLAAHAETGGIGGRPANPDPANPRTQSIFIYTLNKGDSKTDQVMLTNGTNQTQTISLYAVDGITTNTGAYSCQQKVEVNTGVGNWISLGEQTVTLLAQQTKKIDFSITIPATADVGEHDGCIVFQSATDPGAVQGNVRVQTRQAIRVVATIPGKLNRTVSITGFSVLQQNETQKYALNLRNEGNVSADVDAYVRLTNVFGGETYKNGGGYPVLSNDKLNLTFTNTSTPFFGGWYKAQASVSYDERAGTFGTADTSHLVTKKSNQITIFVVPNPIAIGLYVLLLVLIIGTPFALRIRAKRRTTELQKWEVITLSGGESLVELAESRGITWQKLASRNDIHPPYTLEAGMKLKAPVSPRPKKSTRSRKA